MSSRCSTGSAAGVAAGDLTPSEAGELSRVIESYTKAVEVADIDERLRKQTVLWNTEIVQ